MSSPLAGVSVLITGGSGTFGNAFAKRCLDDGAKKVVIYSRSESKQAEMKTRFPDPRIRFLIGDVRDGDRISQACRGIDIVIHAAALKRVEVCEADPNEAIATNITGTINTARACIERGVKRAVLLSTDKAAAPNTLYGMAKATAERVWNASNQYSAGTPTRFSVTRYGNVVGSTGSVIPLWKSQAKSGVITVTDRSMTRFFMSIDEAVNLVILALVKMRGAEIFVPKLLGARLSDLALAVAPGCGLNTVGLRPGEKMHETLITEDEARNTHDCGSYYVIEPDVRTWGEVSPIRYSKVHEGFTYRSDTAERFSREELEEIAA